MAIWDEIKTRTKHTQCCTESIEWRPQGSTRRSWNDRACTKHI